MKINWFGTIGQGQGYSGSGENICIALEELGHDVRLISFNKSNEANLTPKGLKIKNKPFLKSDIAICYGFPLTFNSMQAWKYRFGFTMFETDRLPAAKSWAGPTSNAADSCNVLTRLFVPCEHNRQLFIDTGVTVPIDVVPLGINTDLYPLIERSKENDVFTFLQLGSLSVRKNPGAVIAAFISLFANNPKVRLVIKDQGGYLQNLKFPDITNLIILDRYATTAEMLNYYKEANCFVFPSHGEGFGLPPLEAMATGLPVILANNTGMADFADPSYCYPIKSDSKSPAKMFPKEWGDVGNWYDVDQADLKAKMWHVFNNQGEAYQKGLLASKVVHEKYNYTETAKKIVKIIEQEIAG